MPDPNDPEFIGSNTPTNLPEVFPIGTPMTNNSEDCSDNTCDNDVCRVLLDDMLYGGFGG